MGWSSESKESTALHGTGLRLDQFLKAINKLSAQPRPTPKLNKSQKGVK